MEKYVFSGKTEEEALECALDELSLTKNDILYDVKEQKGGLFKGKKVEITVTKKSDINDFIKETVLKIVTDMGFDAQIETKVRDDILNIVVHTDNLVTGESHEKDFRSNACAVHPACQHSYRFR